MAVGGNFTSCNCGPDSAACTSPTEPVATVGLCLADGTPIAVTVVRDCAGTTTSEGWINLTTGAFSAGAPPAGTIACGDSRSITTNGTFCDVAADGTVLGLVLVEYQYAADGSIASVRLVDAVTGTTYTPQGEVTTCPAGVEQPERDLVQLCDLTDAESGAGLLSMPFVRDYQRDETGQITGHSDYTLDGAPYVPTGTVGVCHPPEAEPCASTVSTLRLCDLNPDVEPDKDGKRCAVPFLRHIVHDCTGALTETRDTAMDGTTPYTPVEVVDCGSGGVPALSELLWPQSGIAEDPAGVARQDFIYTINNPETDETAEVRLHASSLSPGGCGTYDPAAPVFNNPTTYTLTLDAAAQEMSTFRLDLLDFDTFEGVTGLNPIPSRVEGDVTWNGTTITANVSNITAHVYWDNPPEKIIYRYGNTGGGRACSGVAFQGMTLIPGGCCGCGSGAQEPCRDTSSTLLCDTAATDLITVFDPATRPNADGWDVVSYTGAIPGAGPEAAMPYPARYGTPMGYPALGARADQNAGSNGAQWPGYDAAPVRWVLRKTFQAPEDGVAVAQSVGFRGDGGARVRINGVDAGMYGQWNQPATTGTAQIPVTAGPNTVEIEVRDTNGINNVIGRLDIALPHTTQFMRHTVVDCETGEIVSTSDYTLDGDPYTVVGEVGQCEPVAECCEQAPPEQRVDVETELLCIRDEASGDVLRQVLVERVYDDQTGDRLEQRLTDPTTGDLVELPAGAVLARCPSPDRITRQICIVRSGMTEFLTNAGNATSGQDTDWRWAPNLDGVWYPMYEVAPNQLWTVTDPAPNKAHWVSPHANKGVCSPNLAAAPNVTATWYTRASWNLPTDVDPETIRIAATVLNADNDVVQWRLNDGPWQPVAGGQFAPPAWGFPPTAVPGGRAGQNEVIVQILETQPPSSVPCPNGNQAGMILHVAATYDHEPRVWTQVIEDGGQVYYLDENGDRQEKIPDGDRIVPCAGGGDCCPTEDCRDTSTVLLCDLDPECQAGIEPTATDEPNPASFNNWRPGTAPTWCHLDTPGQGAPVWAGGSVVLGPDTKCATSSGGDTHRVIGVHLAAGSPSLTGTVDVTVSLRVTNNGPNPGFMGDGMFGLWDASAGPSRIKYVAVPGSAPVGAVYPLTLSAAVPAAALAAGDIVAILDLETYHGAGPKAWTVDEFTWSAEVPAIECEAQFLRTIVKDCATGATVSVVDTTLDGEPFEVTGDVGQCTPASGGETPQPDPCQANTVIEACRCDDTDGDGVSDTDYVELLAVDCDGALTSIGTYTPDLSAPYTPVAPVPCETGGAPSARGVQGHRVELDPGETWDAAAWPTLQSVTAVARGTGTVTTADGTSSLVASESVTWSVARDSDALLNGPLTVAANTGTVAVSWTMGVNL